MLLVLHGKIKPTGEKKEKTEWHNIVMYRKLAEIAGADLITVHLREDRRHINEVDLKDILDRYTTEVAADTMQMLGGKDNRNSAPSSSDDNFNQEPERVNKA